MTRAAAAFLLVLCVGFGIGLYYAWVIAPAQVADLAPDALRADFKDQYRVAIASAYAATGNLNRAQARLALLGETSSVNELAAQAQRYLAAGQSSQVAEDLARLATDLHGGVSSVQQIPSTPVAALSPSSGSPLASPIPTASTPSPATSGAAATAKPETAPPPPSQTLAPTSTAPFIVLSQDPVCSTTLTPGLLQVTVFDHNRQPMPGIEITITWDAGEEHIFTGLKPEISAGYADFVMQSGTAYSLLVARSGSPVSGLSAPAFWPQAMRAW